jgi:hypothetical protein
MGISMKRLAAATLAAGLVFAGCNAGTPGATGTLPPLVSPTQAPTEGATETPASTPTPVPSATATAAPTATPTIAPTAAPVATPTPVAGDPTACTGWSTSGTEFTKAATRVKFDVYCGVMPSSWHLSSMSWEMPHGSVGKLTATYANKNKSATITLSEGNFCAGCAWVDVSNLGTASFGTLPATLKLRATGQYSLYVNPGGNIQYQAVSKGLSQSQFTALTAALVKVPKS